MFLLMLLFCYSFLSGMDVVPYEVSQKTNSKKKRVKAPVLFFDECRGYQNYKKQFSLPDDVYSYTTFVKSHQPNLPSGQGYNKEYLQKLFMMTKVLYSHAMLSEKDLFNQLSCLAEKHTQEKLSDVLTKRLQKSLNKSIPNFYSDSYRTTLQENIEQMIVPLEYDDISAREKLRYEKQCLSLLVKKESLAALVSYIQNHKEFVYNRSDNFINNTLDSIVDQFELEKHIDTVEEKLEKQSASIAYSDYYCDPDYELELHNDLWYNWRHALQDTVANYCDTIPQQFTLFFWQDLDYFDFGDRKMRQPLANYLYDCNSYLALKYAKSFPSIAVDQQPLEVAFAIDKNAILETVEAHIYSVQDAINDKKGVNYYKDFRGVATVDNSLVRSLDGLKKFLEGMPNEEKANLFKLKLIGTKIKVVDAQEIEQMFSHVPCNQDDESLFPKIYLNGDHLRLIVGAPGKTGFMWHLEGRLPELDMQELCAQEYPPQYVTIIDTNKSWNKSLSDMAAKTAAERCEVLEQHNAYMDTVFYAKLIGILGGGLLALFFNFNIALMPWWAGIIDTFMVSNERKDRIQKEYIRHWSFIGQWIYNKYIQKPVKGWMLYTHNR